MPWKRTKASWGREGHRKNLSCSDFRFFQAQNDKGT